jgi:hypothetical protein
MHDLKYRRFAVDLVREIQNLLIHAGSRNALARAGAWASGCIPDPAILALDRHEALRDCRACWNDPRDGRLPAATAACRLLHPRIDLQMEQLLDDVANARAEHLTFSRYGCSIRDSRESEFRAARVTELWRLEHRLIWHEATCAGDWFGGREDLALDRR